MSFVEGNMEGTPSSGVTSQGTATAANPGGGGTLKFSHLSICSCKMVVSDFRIRGNKHHHGETGFIGFYWRLKVPQSRLPRFSLSRLISELRDAKRYRSNRVKYEGKAR